MPFSNLSLAMVGGHLAIDFANAPSYPATPLRDLSWEEFVVFLEESAIVSKERGSSLLNLSQADPKAAQSILNRAGRLRNALRSIFRSMVQEQKIAPESIEPVNQILRVTEGHDELIEGQSGWRLEFVARESGLEWLLAAIARSAAEIIVEGPAAQVRMCANPDCGLFFCDTSRTGRRRWCSMAVCGNRHKVASFARRHAS